MLLATLAEIYRKWYERTMELVRNHYKRVGGSPSAENGNSNGANGAGAAASDEQHREEPPANEAEAIKRWEAKEDMILERAAMAYYKDFVFFDMRDHPQANLDEDAAYDYEQALALRDPLNVTLRYPVPVDGSHFCPPVPEEGSFPYR